ncbi:hypothetical protein L0P73_19755 [[Clostridium] innocuum]|uniref:hypothetical protein n=1 Tax=Clostridium innocuum TaxID=1522 RepID=UPI001EDF9B1A|nr:hypothetical protein [[Clostridium] innocuum]MCG4662814.1 hypothetical protein [[Clostridium] innocuum]
MTNKELSMKIRKSLKEAGYTQKDIKVSVRSFRYDTAAKITIHNPHIDRHRIEKILRPAYEEIDRDDITGEILQGGNTMLFIEYEYGIFEEVAREWMATAKGLMQSKAEVTRIFDGLYLLDPDHCGALEIRQQDENTSCTYRVHSISHLCEFLYKFAEFKTIAV